MSLLFEMAAHAHEMTVEAKEMILKLEKEAYLQGKMQKSLERIIEWSKYFLVWF